MGLFDGLTAAAGGGDPLSAIGNLLGNHDGGLGGLVQAFEQGGLGEAAQSWVSGDANLPVSADQIRSVLGSDMVARFAEKVGVDPQTAASHLAELLPQVVNHLTPNGEIPQGAVGALEGLLDRFKG